MLPETLYCLVGGVVGSVIGIFIAGAIEKGTAWQAKMKEKTADQQASASNLLHILLVAGVGAAGAFVGATVLGAGGVKALGGRAANAARSRMRPSGYGRGSDAGSDAGSGASMLW